MTERINSKEEEKCERTCATSPKKEEKSKESDELATWLTSIGMAQYIDAFKVAEVDLEILPFLSYIDLREIGVKWQKERLDIMAKIAQKFSRTDDNETKFLKPRKRMYAGQIKNGLNSVQSSQPALPGKRMRQGNLPQTTNGVLIT